MIRSPLSLIGLGDYSQERGLNRHNPGHDLSERQLF